MSYTHSKYAYANLEMNMSHLDGVFACYDHLSKIFASAAGRADPLHAFALAQEYYKDDADSIIAMLDAEKASVSAAQEASKPSASSLETLDRESIYARVSGAK